MIMELTVSTNAKEVVIDYIMVKLKSGKTVSLNWDESNEVQTENGFILSCKDVYMDETATEGRLEELKDLEIVDIGLYTEDKRLVALSIEEMRFYDEHMISFLRPYVGTGIRSDG